MEKYSSFIAIFFYFFLNLVWSTFRLFLYRKQIIIEAKKVAIKRAIKKVNYPMFSFLDGSVTYAAREWDNMELIKPVLSMICVPKWPGVDFKQIKGGH